jgi:hypothetical protein
MNDALYHAFCCWLLFNMTTAAIRLDAAYRRGLK